MIKGLVHIAVNVRNLEQSKDFYRNIIGLTEVDFIFMDDHTLTYFDLSTGIRLELIDYDSKGAESKAEETAIGMYRHICLETDDIGEFYKKCIEKNIYVRMKPSDAKRLGYKKNMLIVDPNGIEIELVQR